MTTETKWRTAFATSIGTSHHKSGVPCQDSARCTVVKARDGTEILVAAVSDGAGTAAKSEVGSTTAVEHFIDHLSRTAVSDPTLGNINQGFVDAWFSDLRNTLAEVAGEADEDISSYACTLLGVVVGPELAAYMQIGDGAIIVAGDEPGLYHWVFWPQHGEYANSTFFVTQHGAETKLQFEKGPARPELALFSDGIERLVLDMSSKAVHAPAFAPIFHWLSGTEPDRSGRPSSALIAYLGSNHVNSRTDDDKALVLATRVEPILDQ